MHSIHDFYVVKACKYGNKKTKYYTGAFDMKRKWLKFWQKEAKPALVSIIKGAQIYFSPKDAEETVNEMRMMYPQYAWYVDIVVLPEYDNMLMQPVFFMAVRYKGHKYFHYYEHGIVDNTRLTFSDSVNYAKMMNIDEARSLCEDFSRQAEKFGLEWAMARLPQENISMDKLNEYIEKSPRTYCLTFNLPK